VCAVKTDLSAGVLVCNGGLVAIRKMEGTSQIQVDGMLSKEYYHIRSLLYSQFREF
jgi:hypothetical protein